LLLTCPELGPVRAGCDRHDVKVSR